MRSEWRWVFDRAHPRDDRALVREAQQFHRRTIGEERDSGKITAQYAEKIQLAVRNVADSITVQVELKLGVPKIPNAVNSPQTTGNIRRAGLDWMNIARKNVFRESVGIRVRAESQADIISRHAIANDFVLVALIKRKSDCVFADFVLLQPAPVGRLENQAISAMAAVVHETVAAHDHVFREHDRGARRVLAERVVLENVPVRIHVVQAV